RSLWASRRKRHLPLLHRAARGHRAARWRFAGALAARLGCDLPQRLFEHRARLTARDQELAVDDDGRHRVDAEPLPESLGRFDLFGKLVAVGHLPSTVDAQADFGRELAQNVTNTGITTFVMIDVEQLVLERALCARRTLDARQAEQSVRIARVPDPGAIAELEPFGRAALLDARLTFGELLVRHA